MKSQQKGIGRHITCVVKSTNVLPDRPVINATDHLLSAILSGYNLCLSANFNVTLQCIKNLPNTKKDIAISHSDVPG